AGRLRHRRLIDAEAPARGIGARHDRGKARALRPIERAQVKLRAGVEFLNAVARQTYPFVDRNHRRQHHHRRRPIDPRAMKIEVGHHALERACAVEHRRSRPGGMRARPHDRRVALMPVAVEKSPGLRPGLQRHHSTTSINFGPESAKPARSEAANWSRSVTRVPGTPMPFASETQSRSGRPISSMSSARGPMLPAPTLAYSPLRIA